jgi:hypothetical protein
MGQLRATEQEFFEHGEVGDWCFINDDGYILIQLHSGEDGTCALPLRVDPADRGGQHPVWRWDGNREAPTLEPSILHHSNPEWHGWMRAGKLVLA